MLAIPLPFVAALLLFITAVLLRYRYLQTSQKPFWFIMLCALMITVVGLRWTVDIALFRYLQPVLGASVPVTAWLCFTVFSSRGWYYLVCYFAAQRTTH